MRRSRLPTWSPVRRQVLAPILVAAILLLHAASATAAGVGEVARLGTPRQRRLDPAPPRAKDEILVRFKSPAPPSAARSAHAASRARVRRRFTVVPGLELVAVPPGGSMSDALAAYRRDPDVAYAEPNYLLAAFAQPDDALFGDQWGFHNVGQAAGVVDADIDAVEAWDVTTGSSDVVVAVIDTGIDYAHADLAPNMFRNDPDCDNDGVDDDGNGFTDDCFGIDTKDDDSDPTDVSGHGTHVAGTVGARSDNGIGVAGTNWNVRMMACRFLGTGGGTTADAVKCLEYLAMMKDRGVPLLATSNSWGSAYFSEALLDAIQAHLERGILFIAAAGNSGFEIPLYPAAYYLPNIISVAATTRTDALAAFSTFGRNIVHLGAPGQEILSTLPGQQYGSFSGTSMAAPHVSGVAALLAAADPGRDWKAIRNLLLAGGDPLPALAETTVTGRRLNAAGSLSCSVSTVSARLRPAEANIAGSVGTPVLLSAIHIDCDQPNGDVGVSVTPGGEIVTLVDDGNGMDQIAGDGVYSAAWVPSALGLHTLSFPGGDLVEVDVTQSVFLRPAPDDGADFGRSIAADATGVLIGAALDDAAGSDAGAAYLFDRAGAVVRSLINPSPDPGDRFGHSVALGETLLAVGASLDDTAAIDSGAVYVFDRSSGTLLHTLLHPGSALESNFGKSIAFVGANVLVGAPWDGTVAPEAGAAFLFDGASGALLHSFSAGQYAVFGHAVAALDGRAVIGAPGAQKVHVFDADPLSPSFGAQVLEIYGRLPVTDNRLTSVAFGYAVAANGNRILVGDPHASHYSDAVTSGPPWLGAGAAHLFDASTGERLYSVLDPFPAEGDYFGFTVALSLETALIGAPQDSVFYPFDGTAFSLDPENGSLRRMLNSPTPDFADLCGVGVAADAGDAIFTCTLDDSGGIDAGAAYRMRSHYPQDHQKCYAAPASPGEPRFSPQTVSLADGIDPKLTKVLRPIRLCNPASENGSAIVDAAAHLRCYTIADAPNQTPFAGADVFVVNAFGIQALHLMRAQTVCIGAGVGGAGEPMGLDRYKCYKARERRDLDRRFRFTKRETELADEIEPRSMRALKPVLYCSPASVDGSPISQPENHLTCFRIRNLPGQTPMTQVEVDATDAFGGGSASLKRSDTICLVSQRLEGL